MWEGRLSARTPVPGLYMCGAATHPAGSVIALNGRNAAAAALADAGVALAAAWFGRAAGPVTDVAERPRAHPRGRLRSDRRARGSTRCGSPGSPPAPARPRRSCTTTSPPARSCSSRRSSTRSRRPETSALASPGPEETATEALARGIAESLPFPGSQEREWVLWVELWLRAVREPALRPVAARLYERYRDWMAALIGAGVESGEFRADVDLGRARGPRDGASRRDRRAGADPGPRDGRRIGADAGRSAAGGRARASIRTPSSEQTASVSDKPLPQRLDFGV